MVFNATFNYISVILWHSVLLVEKTGGPGENHWPFASHWQTLSHNVVHLSRISIRERCATLCDKVCQWHHQTNKQTINCYREADVIMPGHIILTFCMASYGLFT